MKLTIDGQSFEVRVLGRRVEVNGTIYPVQVARRGSQVTVTVGDQTFELEVVRRERDRWEVRGRDRTYDVVALPEGERAPTASSAAAAEPTAGQRSAAAAPATPGTVRAPVPGRIVAVKVKAGDQVGKGDLLVILEAMKMENEIRAPINGVVQQVLVSEGQRVREGETLVVIEG